MSTGIVTRRKRGSNPRNAPQAGAGPQRVQKLLARAGFGSRRKCEEFIREGRVTIDGEVVTELGTKADPDTQEIRFDGSRLRAESLVYYLVNKPKSVVCTSDDPQRRRTILDMLPGERRRVFPVGRLDYESRGAVILTNDGRLTNLLTHPRYGIEKTYQVRVRGRPDSEAMERLRQGVWLSEGRTLPARVWIIKERRDETELGVALCEGKNRQVRRMFAKVGHKCLALTRTRIGPLTLKGLGDGDSRELAPQEVQMLIRLAEQNAQAPAKRPKGRRGGAGSRARGLGKPDPASAPPAPPVDRSSTVRGHTGRGRRRRKPRS